MRAAFFLLTASVLALGACATPPTERASKLPPPGPLLTSASAAFTPDAPKGDWWRLYADPALDGLVGEALTNNRDLAAASANLEQVRASLSEAQGGRLPTTSVSAGYSRGQTTTAQTAPGADRDYDSFNAGFSASYEIDLFGRVRSAIQAATADRDAAAAAVDLVRITVASETARAFVDGCAANSQIAVAQNTLDLQARTAALTQTLLDNGRGNGLDLARAQAAVENTRASLPPLQAQRDSALYRLAVLTGRPPSEASAEARDCKTVPRLSQPIPVGDGAGLLQRRPDVRQADRRLAAASARAGVATASLYPSITLGGSIGSQAARLGDLGNGDSVSFSLGPLISWSFPNLTVARARIAGAQAGADVALAQFDQTVLTALRDTQTALSVYANELDRRAALSAARDRASDAVRLSQLRYDQGADSFLSLIDAQRTLAQAEAALAQSDAAVASDQIAVFQALGGGWQPA